MISGLFDDLPESLSPRERWMRANLVKVLVVEDPASPCGKYIATNGCYTAQAGTYDDVLNALAGILREKERIAPWNK